MTNKIELTEEDLKELDGRKCAYLESKDEVVFRLADGEALSFSGTEVNRWYEWYPSGSVKIKGGLTQAEMATKFNLSQTNVARLFRALGLKKSSPNKAPWIIARHRNNLDGLVEDNFDKDVEDLNQQYKAKYERQRNKFYRDEYFKLRDEKFRAQNLVENMKAYSEAIPFQKSDLSKYSDILDRGFRINLVSVISDWHVGAKGHQERMTIGRSYGSDLRAERLNQLREEMCKYRSRFRGEIGHLTGYVLGDMIDDPLSNTFPHQAIEQDTYGAQQVVEAQRSITDHILFHYDLFQCPMTWHLVKGNHGYEFEKMMYYWIKENLKEYTDITVEVVEPRYSVSVDEFSDTQIIAIHGDGGVKPEKIGNLLPCNNKHRLILHGHLHHLNVVEIPRGYKVMCPSLMGGNAYSQDVFYADSKAGQIMVELHEDGPRPVVYLPLK